MIPGAHSQLLEHGGCVDYSARTQTVHAEHLGAVRVQLKMSATSSRKTEGAFDDFSASLPRFGKSSGMPSWPRLLGSPLTFN